MYMEFKESCSQVVPIAWKQVVNLNRRWGQQDEREFRWLLSKLGNGKRILEIGSCFGRSLEEFAQHMGPGSHLFSIDLGVGTHALEGIDTGAHLLHTVAHLRQSGYNANVLLASSMLDIARHWAWWHAPYDLVFIDGDHSFAGAWYDWKTFGPLGKIVAFHDIAYKGHEVRLVWDKVKRGGAKTEELVLSKMGIGVVHQPQVKDDYAIELDH